MNDAWRERHERVKRHQREFVGLSRVEAEELAKELGFRLRVIDETVRAITLELRPDRINLYVRDGIVYRAVAG